MEQVDEELEGMLEKYLGPVEEVADEELDKFVAEKQSLLAMTDDELGFTNEPPKVPKRITEDTSIEAFKKASEK